VQIAVKRIIEGQWIYFTCGIASSKFPFRIELRERVVSELKQQGYELIEFEEISNGSSIFGPTIKGQLEGVYVYLKAVVCGF
jgi:hypothetical protein